MNLIRVGFVSWAALFALAGCGGGGGGTTPSVTLPTNGQSAAVTAGQGTTMMAAATQASSAPSIAHAAATQAFGNPLIVWLGNNALTLLTKPPTRGTWTQIQGSVFYYEIASQTATSAKILLSTDGTTNNAGYISESLVQAGPPAIVDFNYNMILPSQTITGTGSTSIDSSGNITSSATLKSSGSGATLAETVTVNLGTASYTASIKVTKDNLAITFTNIASASTSTGSTTTANFTLGTVTGTLALNSDSSGSVQTTDSAGTWKLTWDVNLNATLTSPSGAVTTGLLTSMAA